MIQFGLIGAGPNGRGNIRRLTENKQRARLAAVADLNPQLGSEAAKELGDDETRVVESFEDFLETVDAVVISSPNFLHCDQAIACAEAGKHLWIEKPMALSVAEADRICAAVDKAGVHSFVGFSVRFGGVPRTIARYYREGGIGELRSIWSRRLTRMQMKASWRKDFVKSGGVMSELIAHEIDWMLDAAGLPESVHCRIQSDAASDPRDNDYVWMMFDYGPGATGSIEGAQNADIADYYKGIVGSTGSIADRSWGQEVWFQKKNEPKADQLEPDEPFCKHRHFLDVLEGKAQSVADVHWGRRVVAITERALESAVRGEIVSLKGI